MPTGSARTLLSNESRGRGRARSRGRRAILVLALPGCLVGVRVEARNTEFPFRNKFSEGFPSVEDLSFETAEGDRVSGEEFLGQGVVLVFFTSSCSKCTSKLPLLEEVRQTFEAEGLTVVGLPIEGGGRALPGLKRRFPFDWVWAGNAGELRTRLGSSRIFDLFVFDREGKIAYQFLETDSRWRFHLEIGLGAILERSLDLGTVTNSFVGSMVCGMCHPVEWRQWVETGHAESSDTLRAAGRHQSIECIACHVTGERGRAARPWRLTPKEFQEVGCEECHGPGGPHRTQPFPEADLYGTSEASCVRCHDEKNSPDWNYAEYLKKVVHRADEAETEPKEADSTPPKKE